MNAKMKFAAAAAVLLVLGACDASCKPDPADAPTHTVDEGTSCAAGALPAGASGGFGVKEGGSFNDPYHGARPPDVKPGNKWVVLELTVFAFGNQEQELENPGYDFEYCVPVAIHVLTTTAESDAVVLDNGNLPVGAYDYITTTPWLDRWVALQYDPTDQRFAGRPPKYEVYLEATYLPERDELKQAEPAALRCGIWWKGLEVVHATAFLVDQQYVQCRYRDNQFWNDYDSTIVTGG